MNITSQHEAGGKDGGSKTFTTVLVAAVIIFTLAVITAVAVGGLVVAGVIGHMQDRADQIEQQQEQSRKQNEDWADEMAAGQQRAFEQETNEMLEHYNQAAENIGR